jgi:uncharacterized protein (TIGR02466 family)
VQNEAIPISVRSTTFVTLFPTHVWRTQLEPSCYEPLNRKLRAKLGELTATGADERRMVQQTEQRLHLLPEFREFVQIVNGCADSVLEFLKVRHQGFQITGCWANVSRPGAGHEWHSHPNNLLSGVYYLRAPKGGNAITFYDPRPQAAVIAPPLHEISRESAGKIDFPVSDGDLILFPSWLYHSVPRNGSAEFRVSIAFNIMLAHFAEAISPPLWEGNVPVR